MNETDNKMSLSQAIDLLKNSTNLNPLEREAFEYIREFIDRIISLSIK